jgi:MFS transporter, DHA1 family, tetracycline resistance protein
LILNRDLHTVRLTVFLDSLGFTIVIPVFPEIVQQLSDQGSASIFIGLLMTSYAMAQLIAAPFIGALSDKIGRRPVLVGVLAISVIDYVLSVVATEIWLLFAARVIAGAAGGTMTVASAYIVDRVTADDRVKQFGFLQAAFSLGFVIGPLIGGVVGHWHIRGPFVLAAALSALNLVFAFLFLRDKPPVDRGASQNPRFFRFASNALAPNQADLARLLIAFALIQAAKAAAHSAIVLFLQLKFQWSAVATGFALTMSAVVVVIAQAVLAGKAVAIVGEIRTMRAGLLLSVMGYCIFAFAGEVWHIVLAILIWSLGFAAEPAMQGLISRDTDESRKGEMQGYVATMNSIGWIAGPIVGGLAFGLFDELKMANLFGSGAFLLGAVLCIVAMIVISYDSRSKISSSF